VTGHDVRTDAGSPECPQRDQRGGEDRRLRISRPRPGAGIVEQRSDVPADGVTDLVHDLGSGVAGPRSSSAGTVGTLTGEDERDTHG
jgi:hypothetical protein